MGRINILDPQTANAIKAGEVVERPVSVVKELVDNSVDAGSTMIRIEIEQGGIGMIRVSDNGIGMDEEDACKAFLIHATSKIRHIEELYDLSTQGFRGEALASIAACSEVTLITRQPDKDSGILVRYDSGARKEVRETSADIGTVVEVKHLFANIPARYKFLKKDSTEAMYVVSLVEKLAIINPDIAFKLVKDGKMLLATPGSGDMLDTIYSIHGREVASMMVPVEYTFGDYRITGFAGKTDCVRGNRGLQYIYVNNRAIRNKTVTAAIDEAYKNAVMKNKYPVCFLSIYAAPGQVDVNVHPQKSEVRFTNETDVFRLVYHGIRNSVFAEGDADHKFRGIRSDDPDIDAQSEKTTRFAVNTSVTEPVLPGQLKYNVPSHSTVTPSAKEVEATNQMLKILSEFKPELDDITGKSETIKDERADNIEEITTAPDIRTVEDEPETDITELASGRVAGFLFDTYIVVQSDNSVFFVDQHAAHERVLYERFMARKLNETVAEEQEVLLVPQIIDLPASDYSFVSDNYDRFRENGFDIDVMGSRQVAIRAVPMTGSRTKPSDMFIAILSDLKKEVPSKDNVWYSLIQTTACKAAIKANDRITVDEAIALIKQLSVLEDPYHCAHGRPTFIKVTRTEFEKNFKRIVC